MATARVIGNKATPPNPGLSLLLRQANSALARLKQRADKAMALKDPVAAGFSPRQIKTLCGIIDEGRRRIRRCLDAEDDPAILAGDESPEFVPTTGMGDPASFMAQYRFSCRLLCRALNEALSAADARVGAMLSDLVLRLEKQLWLMDTHGTNHGSDRHRSVSLFLTC
jgi:hypothetical protein